MAENGSETIQAGWGRFSLAAKGPVGIILISLYAGIALDLYFEREGEQIRRVVEQEVRIEISTIKASLAEITHSVSRYCAVPELDVEMERITTEYKERIGHANKLRQKLGLERIGPPQPESRYQRE